MSDQEAMHMSEDSSSSHSDSSAEDEERKLELQSKQLEIQLSENRYAYDIHIQLVDIYEQLADFTSFRTAYQRFHQCFPLTPKLWLKWIKNEMKVATSEQEKLHVFELFDKAVEDYLSVNLWQEYAQYVMEVKGFQDTRNVLEKALNSAGLHVSDGSLLWDFTREIELAHLSLASKNSDEWKEQVQKVIDIFRRQLSVPLIGMQNTYNEWQIWRKSLPEDFKFDPQPIEWGYQKASKLLEIYKPFEDELVANKDEQEVYDIYKKYIASVQDPSTIICLYERAVFHLCLNPTLWLDYCNYTFKLGEVAFKTCEKSLRNCPWNEDLWIMRLRIQENLNAEESELLSSFEKGLASISPSPGLQLWLSYIEFVKRNGNEQSKLYKLLEQAIEQVGDYDSNCSLSKFHARILAKSGEVKSAIGIWNKIMGKPQNKGNSTLWLEFIALVKQFGEPNQVRSLYQKALNSCKSWAYYVTEEWLLFEREVGTLANVMSCVEKCKTIDTSAEQSYQQAPEQQENSYNTQSFEGEAKGKKRKNITEIKSSVKKIKQSVEKFTVEPKKPIEKDPTKTVFISNISSKVDEVMLKTMFPNAVNIEVCRDRKGKSKLFGYVQFSMEEEVTTALARDREPLESRPVFISNCKPDKNERKPVFKYSSAVEENKLFVRGLPKKLTKEEVLEIFKPYGALDARIVLHRSGQSKGLAYVEFPDHECTKKALVATDQKQIDEHTISVAVSAPPPKKAADEKIAEPLRDFEPTRHARSRLQVPFVPRSVQVKSDKTSNGSNSDKPSKSNDDFRKMLLNK